MDEQIKKIVLIGMHNASEAYCTRMSVSYLNRFFDLPPGKDDSLN